MSEAPPTRPRADPNPCADPSPRADPSRADPSPRAEPSPSADRRPVRRPKPMRRPKPTRRPKPPSADPSRAAPSPNAPIRSHAPTRQSDPMPQRAISADHHAGGVDVGRHRPHGGTRKVAASRTAHVHRGVHICGRRDHWHADHPRAVARAHVGGPERRRRLGARLAVHQPCRRMTTERSAREARGQTTDARAA